MITAISCLFLWMLLGALRSLYLQWRRKQANRAASYHRGCLPCPKLKNKMIFGFDRIVQLLLAGRNCRQMASIQSLFCEVGTTFEHILLRNPDFATIEPENIAAVLTKDKDFGIEPRRAAIQPIFWDGIFTQEGLEWSHSRIAVRHHLQYKYYGTLEVFRNAVDDLIRVVREDGGLVDLQPLFYRLSLDATTEFLFGESVRSLVASKESNGRKFADAFDNIQKQAMQRLQRTHFDLLSWLPPSQAWKNLSYITDHMIERNLSREADCEKTLFLRAMARETADRAALKGQLLNILGAGRDTTACLLSWAFFLLVRHPQVLQKLRTECASTAEFDPALSRTTLKRMRYLQNVLKETLRLYPPIPVNFRTASKDTMIPTGGGQSRTSSIFIPKGRTVAFCSYAMHRRQDLYGTDS
ncbi:n-alkane-inducible cytochrome P450, partial [Pyrenochaeta sp. DS3sAY3a]